MIVATLGLPCIPVSFAISFCPFCTVKILSSSGNSPCVPALCPIPECYILLRTALCAKHMTLNLDNPKWRAYRSLTARSPKVWPPLINSHSFMQPRSNQKPRTGSSWLLIGWWLHERMWINLKRWSHFWAPCCKYNFLLSEVQICLSRAGRQVDNHYISSLKPWKTCKLHPPPQ